jgi:CDP-glucose 4,6-dehydratase
MEKSVGALLKNLEGPVLVTGHTGFKGTWLIRYLKILGIEAVGYSLPPKADSLYSKSNLFGKTTEQFGDIRRLDDFAQFVQRTKPGVILHLAAQALVSDSYLDPIGTFETNVMGTANVLQVGKSTPGLKAIGVVTTDKVYRNHNDKNRFKEDDPIFGSDPYSASKAACENVVQAWKHIATENHDFPISSLRAGNVIGGGDLSPSRLIPDLVRGHSTQTEVVIRNIQSTRPWQHVLDPLTGYLLAVEHSIREETHQTFNFGPDEPSLSVGEVIDIFQQEWRDLQIVHSPVTSFQYESNFLDLNSDLAKNNLGWRPAYKQKTAIHQTINWWDDYFNKRSNACEIVDEQIKEYLKN